jgi:hypothetical protein
MATMSTETIIAQLKVAQAHLDAGNFEAADGAMPIVSWAIREQFPEISRACNGLDNDINEKAALALLAPVIPLDFRVFDASLYPCPESLALALATPLTGAHDDDGHDLPGYKGGILAWGESGSGKTRAMFEVARFRIKETPHYRLKYCSAPALKRRLADAARAGQSQGVFDDLFADEDAILFIDDLSQPRLSAAFAGDLFEIIDRICREHRRLLVTVQSAGTDLVRKWCSDDPSLVGTAQAIARRLRDYCTPIHFIPKAKTPKDEPSP